MGWLLHDPLTRFLLQLAVVITTARLLGVIARRVGQPMVIAEIVAGILLGPSLLGWVAPDVSAKLFAPSSLDNMKMVSQLGLVLFMFLVGLELDPRMLRGRGTTSLAISHTSIVLPFGLGLAAAAWLHADYAPAGVSTTAFALFMGAAMSITAFPVLARILSERQLLRTKIGAIAIACAAVDDVTAWCLLAFVVAVTRAAGLEGAIVTTALALGYILAMVVLVRPLLARLAASVATRETMSQNVVAIVLVLVLVSSWATERIGIHALFGAFLFGAILPKDGNFARSLADRLEDVVVIALLPLFFAFSGLRTEIGLLDSARDWLVCGALIALACLGKFGGGFVAARLTGLSWREAGAIGVLMNTRGLMELIVLNIGLDLGVISPAIFSMMVLMALVTTFVTSPLLQWIYPPREYAREGVPDAAPAAEKFRMLACVSHAETGASLVAIARVLATDGAQLVALHLAEHDDRGSALLGGDDASTEALAPALTRAVDAGLPVRSLSFGSNDPADDICQVAIAHDVDLVLLGMHKPVLSQTLLGGAVHDVLAGARATVAVFVDRGLRDVKRVLVPFQGSPHDRAALALAARVQRATGATITVLHVISGRRAGGPGKTDFSEAGGTVTIETIEHASPAAAAIERSGDHDLVIVGVGKEWGLGDRRLGFGLQPERLIRDCATSLLVVRRHDDTPPLAEARIA